MKLNLIIRTYKVENLKYSLFEVPKTVDGLESLRIIVHNDNPDRSKECQSIIDEFNRLYPGYEVILINESVNQMMLMSSVNSITKLNKDYEWTMIVDDDDYPIINKSVCESLDECWNCSKVWTNTEFYKLEDLSDNLSSYQERIIRAKSLPNFIRTKVLLELYNNLDVLVKSLTDIYGTTKIGNTEDWILLYALNVIEDKYFKSKGVYINDDFDRHNPLELVSMVVREVYHKCNGYESWQSINKIETQRLFRLASRFRNRFLYLINNV